MQRGILILLLAAAAPLAAQQYDLLIRSGRVIDPANDLDAVVDIAVQGPKIARVASGILPDQAKKVIDASGAIVTPGLIDLHAHVFGYSGSIFPDDNGSGSFWFRIAVPAIRQGVLPDKISTIHKSSIMLPHATLTNVMSKFLNIGMTLKQVIERTTVIPQRRSGATISEISTKARLRISRCWRSSAGVFRLWTQAGQSTLATAG